ncbi:MAG TPA: hypothetical protein VNK51_02980 [Bradyrhizobium sp.]|nr:hypothetical protein [Bradyrhizobium sp.]
MNSKDAKPATFSLCAKFALMLASIHTLTTVGLVHQTPWVNSDDLVTYSVWFMPAVALLLCRHVPALVITYALPLCLLFAVQLHSSYLQFSQGVLTLGQTLLQTAWASTILGTVSALVVAFWMLLRSIELIQRLVSKFSQ